VSKKLIGTAVFLRHGETNYTNVFPDLTESGKETIRNSAKAIRAIRNQYFSSLAIVSSPAVRALGSACIVAETLNFTTRIIEVSFLSPAKVKDAEKGQALFNEYVSSGGMRGLCIAYGSDKRFEDGVVIEARSQIRSRFYKHLSVLVRNMLSCDSEFFVVNISHYEVLYHFVETCFQLDYTKDPPLGFGEIILMSFYDIGSKDAVEICLTFREMSANNIVFNHKIESIVASS